MKILRAFAGGAACTLALLMLAGCDDSPTPPPGEAGLRVVAGGSITDTIETNLATPLVVEVRRQDGSLAVGVNVRFDILPNSGPVPANSRTLFLCQDVVTNCGTTSFAVSITDTTRASGRASVLLRLGRVAGVARLQVSAPTLGFIDTVEYTVTPGALSAVRADPRDVSVSLGSTATIVGRARDRWGNIRTDAVTATLGAGSSITFNAATGAASAVSFGTQYLRFAAGSFADSTLVRAVPAGRLAAIAGNALHLVNTDGSNVRPLVTGIVTFGINPSFYPRFDPERRRVSFQSGNNVGQTDVSVVDTATLVRRLVDGASGINSILATRLLADGTLLAVAQRNNVPGYVLFRIETNNTATPIVNLPGLVSINGLGDISPDGTRVLYAVTVPSVVVRELRILTVATGAVQRFEQNVDFLRWSRLGDKLVFAATDGVAIMNADGTGRRLVAPLATTGALTWSSDDAYILATVTGSLRVIRVSDGAGVTLQFRDATGEIVSYREPDWR